MFIVEAVMWIFAGVLVTLAGTWVYAVGWIIHTILFDEDMRIPIEQGGRP